MTARDVGDSAIGEPPAVELAVWQWRRIAAVLNNQIDFEAEGGDEDVVAACSAIRDSGQEQILRGHLQAGPVRAWPPDDERRVLTLTSSQWDLVAGLLEDWADVTPDGASAHRLRAVRDIVLRATGTA